jgi:curved DNA-binding protein CbpA
MPPRPIGQRREALRLLGLQDPVERTEVLSAYRGLVRQHHPDLGGDPDAFRCLTGARDVLLTDARTDPGDDVRMPAGRSVRARQRPRRRFVRALRRRLGRKRGGGRNLE